MFAFNTVPEVELADRDARVEPGLQVIVPAPVAGMKYGTTVESLCAIGRDVGVGWRSA